MNKSFLVVKDNGQISGWVFAPTGEYNTHEGESLIAHPHVDYNYNYYDFQTQEVKPKQDYELSSLPIPCTVTIEGQTYEVNEQPQFEFDVPSVYQIHVDAGPQYYKKVFDYDYNP